MPGVSQRQGKPGDVLMLENVRFNAEENLTMKPEEAAACHLVRGLPPLAALFVNDASADGSPFAADPW